MKKKNHLMIRKINTRKKLKKNQIQKNKTKLLNRKNIHKANILNMIIIIIKIMKISIKSMSHIMKSKLKNNRVNKIMMRINKKKSLTLLNRKRKQ